MTEKQTRVFKDYTMGDIRVLENKYSISILAFLWENKEGVCKSRIQEAMGADKTVLNRLKQLKEAGLISYSHAEKKKNNAYIVCLTESGEDIARTLVSCKKLLEGLA